MNKRVKHAIADRRSLSLFTETGQHCLLTGATGSGKTTLLFWIIQRFVDEHRNETIIFRDTSKANESLFLSNFKELRYLVPEGCNIAVPNNAVDIEVCNFSSYDELFGHITKDKINIISVWRFLSWEDDLQSTDFWAYFFKELVRRSLSYQLPIPVSIIIDELSQITPSHVTHPNQTRLSRYVAKCVELLRGVDVRLLGTSQGWTKLYKPVRISFPYYIFKRVAERIDMDIPVLKMTTNKIQSLRVDQFVMLTPEKYYTEPYDGIPDLKIKEFARNNKLRYEGNVPPDWQCQSELRPKQKQKEKDKAYLNIAKFLVLYIYENAPQTQKQIANMVGRDPKTISRWIQDVKDGIIIDEEKLAELFADLNKE